MNVTISRIWLATENPSSTSSESCAASRARVAPINEAIQARARHSDKTAASAKSGIIRVNFIVVARHLGE